MVDHIKIFIVIFSTFIGVAVVVYIYNTAKKYSYSFLHTLSKYTIFYILIFLGLAIIKYFEINISDNSFPKILQSPFGISSLLMILIEIGLIVYLIKTVFNFLKIELSSQFNKIIITFIIFIILSYVLKLLLPIQSSIYKWINTTHIIIWNNLIILEFPILLGLLLWKKANLGDSRKKIISAFCWLFLSRYLFVALIILTIKSQNITDITTLLLSTGFFFYMNLLPFLWVKYFFIPFAESRIENFSNEDSLDKIFEQHHISNREREIVHYILKGLTNREIGNSLFIAVPTVKNHIYNIYQKLGIKTRYQMMHFIKNYPQE